MKTFEHTTTVKAAPAKIWSVYKDVTGWPQWDLGLEYVTLDGDFAAGTTGILMPKGGPKVKYFIGRCEKERIYEDISKLPLCRIRFYHEIKPASATSATITHRVSFEGPLAFFFCRVIGKDIFATMPETMENFARLAEAA